MANDSCLCATTRAISRFMRALIGLLLCVTATAQQSASWYRMPPDALAAIVDAAPTPSVSVDPTHKRLLLLSRPGAPSIAELARPELRIAGMRINPANNGISRSAYITGITILDLESKGRAAVTGLPDSPRVLQVSWSPDGAQIALTLGLETRIELWIAGAATAKARRLLRAPLNAAFGQPVAWLPDSAAIIAKTVPADRGLPPVRQPVPAGPIVQESSGRPAAARTYQDLLQDAHDEALFEYYAASQIVRVSLDGETTPIGAAGLHNRAAPSPDGRFLLVETVHRPFSYLVPQYRFPRTIAVWSRAGNALWQLADLPLAEEVPVGRGAVPIGARSAGWRSDTPATVYWVEAQDGGDPRREAEVRDTVFSLGAPFSGEKKDLISLALRYNGISWGEDNLALVREGWSSTRQTRTWAIAPGVEGIQPKLLFDRSTEDRYGNPGSPVTERNQYGRPVLRRSEDGSTIYLSGAGASPEGDRPFLDALNLATGETARMWQSEGESYASFVSFLGDGGGDLLIRRETPTEPANYFAISGVGPPEQLTHFAHPYPQLTNVYREILRYERNDGAMLTGTLYLPPGKTKEDGPFPMLMWAYPREYKDAAAAGQMRGSPYRFKAISPTGPLPFLTTGYAILDGPTMPIVGEGDTEPNDAFVEQLVSSAEAAIDEVVRLGVASRDRIAIGGHSYGAFMTANLLAHSDLFAAGLARSGAYNRTLTPFGFQAEDRTFWEAPEVYFDMSPFMHAQKINEPLLLIHGAADNNSGTFPLQSRRFYNALKGHGVKTRLVMLPHESHGYRARESLMHTLYEMNDWMDRFVKNVPE